MAEAGKNVLFVDADMRNSVLISRYKITKASNGLSNFLAGQKELDDVMYTTNIDGLYVLTAGMLPAEPALLLESDLFANFIIAAREKFDYVIIDTPADSAYRDAQIAAALCDGTLFVVANKKLGNKKLIAIKESYEACGCKVLGVVINRVKESGKGK